MLSTDFLVVIGAKLSAAAANAVESRDVCGG